MFIPQDYFVALALMVFSMLCWGSWANTQKVCKQWRFEFYYWDYVWGSLLTFSLAGITLGRLAPGSPESFFRNLGSADHLHIAFALTSGVIFTLGNLLLVAAVAVAGLAVAFPVGVGLSLVIGSVLNYFVTPKGNPLLLFGGIAMVSVAIVLDALAYRSISADVKVTIQGVTLSLVAGLGIGVSYPFFAKSIVGQNHLSPYGAGFLFAIGILLGALPLNYFLCATR